MAETKINKNQAGIGVFTEDNLVGGTNVTLTDKTIISGGGIDSHTVLMLHCDDNLTDSSQYASTATINNYASGSTDYVDGEFDKAVRNNQANWFFATNDTAFLPVRQLTLDFWTYLSQSSSSINITIHSAGGGNAVRFYYWSGNGTINIDSFNDVGSASASLTSADYDKFHHIAITFDSNKLIKLYMDGTLKATLDVSASEYGLSQGIDEIHVSCESTSRYCIFDEFRLSDNIRYTADFTPAEAPYDTNAIETTVKAINGLDSETVSGLGMPSSSYDDLTLGASGATYTAVANGWVEFVKQAGGAEYMQFRNNTSGWFQNVNADISGPYVSILAPVQKNDVFEVIYNLSGSTSRFRFYYAEGSKQ